MVYLMRREWFNVVYKLWVEFWSDEENLVIFGKCVNKNWYGYNYWLYVIVKGIFDFVIGFIIDVKKLSKIIKVVIIDKVDYSNFNLDVDFIFVGM